MESFLFLLKAKEGCFSKISFQTHSCHIPILTFHLFASSQQIQKAETEVNINGKYKEIAAIHTQIFFYHIHII